nr:GNAT family N-acetyltransferase [Cytobacillus gottheilii]
MNYVITNSISDDPILDGIIELHKVIFGCDDDLINKMANKPKLLFVTAMLDMKVVGYKIGYEHDATTFYSWLGGVDPNYRNSGIASALMRKQHQYLMEKGYRVVQTKTMNKWRHMLILNIKNGFDVLSTYTDEKGWHKIILEKKLHNEQVND